MAAEPWVCPWGICNHDDAQACRAAPSSRDACGRRFPPGTTLAQAVAMVRPATDPVSRVMVAADKYWEASTAARQRARAELEQVVREALGVLACPDAQRLVGACAPFLKDGETPAECIERWRKDAQTAICAYYNDAHRYRAFRAMWLDREGAHAASQEMCRADTAEQFDKALDEARAARGVQGTLPPEDSYPDQTVLHDERNVGNCLQATIAGVLGWPLSAVPHFALLGEDHWWDCAQAWLSSQGYWIDYQPTSYAKEGGELLPRCWLSGRSPRGFSHAVIGDSATLQMLHDPHPTRAGLLAVDYTIYFFRKPAGVKEDLNG